MPNDTMPDAAETAAHNAEIARKVAGQDVSGLPTATGEFGEATSALDALAAQVKPAAETAEATAKPSVEPKVAAVTKPKPDATPAAEAAPKLEAAPAPTPEEAAIQKRSEELFKGALTLPPNASPKSAEAFSSIKIKAAQEISAREQQIADLEKRIEAAKNPSPVQLEQEKELETLRQWRQKLDVDFDPKFKTFDQTIAQNREFIYAQLSKSPAINAAVIEQIKKYGGPDMVNLSKLFESIKDPTIQRLVESKVADIEMAKYSREQAVTTAKTNLNQYLQERKVAIEQEGTTALTATVSRLDGLLGALDWFSEKKAEAGADEAAKKEIASHNAFLTETKQQIAEAAKDNSPEMRAILITGMAQLFHLQRRVPALEAQLSAAQKEVKDISAKWEAVKSSSRSRLVESQAPANGIVDLSAKTSDVHQRTGDALDQLAQKVMEQRAAARQGA